MSSINTTENSNTYKNPPKLERPGAGLPWFETLVAKYWFVFRLSKKMSWDEVDQWFVSEGEKILKLAHTLNAEQLQEKVLIPRITGIEDSSRFWSVAMTLEHLMIVGQGMFLIASTLSRGEKVNFEVDVAKVKPLEKISGAEACAIFEGFMKDMKAKLKTEIKDRDSTTSHKHPWFNQLTARHWHWLMASHQQNHRRQIKLIIKGLPALH